jgi:hypothetical protein
MFKIACERLPIAEQELLASQPTPTRVENRVEKRDVALKNYTAISTVLESVRTAIIVDMSLNILRSQLIFS